MSEPLASPTRCPRSVVALVGNPNTGKSTVFNSLTGFRQRVANYPGVTVEKRVGLLHTGNDTPPIDLIDLPGAYSLAAHGADEAVVMDVLLGQQGDVPEPKLIVVVVDASHLARNLFFTTQILELGKPVVVALNMMDIAAASGTTIDPDALGSQLGVPVVPVIATRRDGIDSLRNVILTSLNSPPSKYCAAFPNCVCAELDGLTNSLAASGNASDPPVRRAEALQTLLDPGGYHEDRLLRRCGLGLAQELAERRRRIQATGESIAEVEASVRYAWINRVVAGVAAGPAQAPGRSLTESVDRTLTHPLIGLGVLIIMMSVCFQAVYSWATPLMDAMDDLFNTAGGFCAMIVPAGAVQSLIVNGALAGVGAVLTFLPQILILFLFLAILEDCGYLARAALLLDRWMGLVGLNGRSFIPLLSSFACAVPGIMATRTIAGRRDRLVTILIAPLMSCSARLPVYVLLIGAFVPAHSLLGGLVNLQAVTLLALYTVGIVVAILVALILKHTVLRGEVQSFLLELPSYKWPSVRTVFHRVFEQGKAFCVSAGSIIFAVTLVVWALGYYPHPARVAADHQARRASVRDAHEERLQTIAGILDPSLTRATVIQHEPVASALAAIKQHEESFSSNAANAGWEPGSAEWLRARAATDKQIAAVVTQDGPAGDAALKIYVADRHYEEEWAKIDRSESGTYLRESVLGRMGGWIEPLVKPMGWDWRIGTAVIASFPAREIVVATMGTIYNLGDQHDETSTGLRAKLRQAAWPDGRPVFNIAVALSIMVFFALCCQCGATLATIKRETNSWRWPMLTFVYMTALAYAGALATYQIAVRFI